MTKIILGMILVLGALIRLYALGEFPPGFHRDEAFLGYNAFSLLNTGKNLAGDFLPLHLRSFIHSPAGYSYFTIPFIHVFDLNPFSVRLASALFGIMTIPLIYFLSYEVSKKKRIALTSTFIFSILPWHITLSRTATENSIVTFFIVLGVLVFLKYAKSNYTIHLLLSFLSFAITLTIYQAPRAFLPLFIPLIFLLFRKKIKHTKIFILSYLTLILLPTILVMLSPELSTRVRTVSLFASTNADLVITEQLTQEHLNGSNQLISRIFHNKLIYYSKEFLQNYANHFSFNFLATDNGLPNRYQTPLAPLIFISTLPFVLLGILNFFKEKYSSKKLLLLSWIALTPIGSSLAFDDVPNLQRTLFMAPPIIITASIGFFYFMSNLKNNKFKLLLTFLAAIVVMYEAIFFLRQYFIHTPQFRPWYRQDGYKELVKEVNSQINSYEKVIVTNRESAPTIFFLFFGKYDPAKFHKQTDNKSIIDYDRVSFDNLVFSQEECPLKTLDERKEVAEINALYVNSGLCEVPKDAEIVKVIERRDSSVVFYILKIKANK